MLFFRLGTFVPMIIGEVRRYLRDNNAVRVSRSLRDTAYRAMQTREQLQNRDSREPSVGAIAAAMGADTAEVVAALESVVDPVSLYDPLYSDSGDPAYVFDQLSGGEGEGDWLCELSFRQAVGSLPEREKRILALRFLSGRTQMEVADAIGISQAQVSRLEKNALTKIKQAM